MARLIWTEPALLDLDAVADFIALEDPSAASRFVKTVFKRVERLAVFPHSGKNPQELLDTPYRELVIPPLPYFLQIAKRFSIHPPHHTQRTFAALLSARKT